MVSSVLHRGRSQSSDSALLERKKEGERGQTCVCSAMETVHYVEYNTFPSSHSKAMMDREGSLDRTWARRELARSSGSGSGRAAGTGAALTGTPDPPAGDPAPGVGLLKGRGFPGRPQPWTLPTPRCGSRSLRAPARFLPS
ncbi:hypothetical protein H8959_013935 [Pygathrix nigripes]